MRRDAQSLQIGTSAMRWIGDSLHIDLNEVSVPWPARIRGTVTLHAPQRFSQAYALAEQHRWCPIAPAAQVEVTLGALRWSGPGYLDANFGDAPLELAFKRWDWSRARLTGGRSAVFYDVDRTDDTPLRLGVCFHPNGCAETIDGPPQTALPSTGWRVARGARADAGTPARVLQTLTDAPFYARSLIKAHWLGEPVTAMHESLSLTRFDSAWVQALLPFRMPRVAG